MFILVDNDCYKSSKELVDIEVHEPLPLGECILCKNRFNICNMTTYNVFDVNYKMLQYISFRRYYFVNPSSTGEIYLLTSFFFYNFEILVFVLVFIRI